MFFYHWTACFSIMASEEVQVMNRSLDLSFGLLVALLNIFELYLLLVRVKKRKNYENILLSLSLADLLFGLSNAVVCFIFLTDSRKPAVLEALYTTFYFFVTTSILHLTLINLDRLWTVSKPIKHKIYFTGKRVKQALAVVWAIGIIVSVSLVLTNELTSTFKTKTRVSRETSSNRTTTTLRRNATSSSLNGTRRPLLNANNTVIKTFVEVEIEVNNFGSEMKSALSVIIIVADFAFIACNAAIVYLLFRHSKNKIKTSNLSSQNTERKVSIICVVVTLTFVLFTMPFAILKLVSDIVPVWANILLVMNSGMNSIVYFFRGRIENFFSRFFKEAEVDVSGLQNSATLQGSQTNIPLTVKSVK